MAREQERDGKMEEKYINKILNFSDDIIGKGEELIINREQAKGIIKELEQDYVPKAVIRLKIKELNKLIKECREDERYCGEIPIYAHDIQVLQKLLGE